MENDLVTLLKFFPGREEGTINYRTAWGELIDRFVIATQRDGPRCLRLSVFSRMPTENVKVSELIERKLQERTPPKSPKHLKPLEGCTRVSCPPGIVKPDGTHLGPKSIDVEFGCHGPFPISHTDEGELKFTPSAWTFVTQATLEYTIPRHATELTYVPDRNFQEIFTDEDGLTKLNLMPPRNVVSKPGDTRPFWEHLEKLLPDEKDRWHIYYYMAAIVQNPGRKASWAPVIQGGQGNGKTLLVSFLEYAVGKRRTIELPANKLLGRFNAHFQGKVLVVVNELFCPEMHTGIEYLKGLITDAMIAIEGKGRDIREMPNTVNFFFLTNHRSPVRDDERRYAIYYTPQQNHEDMLAWGMDSAYFRRLHEWADNGGRAAVTHELETVQIPFEYNPFEGARRAPITSCADEVARYTVGAVESEILDAVESEAPGFCGGWISVWAAAQLLQNASRRVSKTKIADILQRLGYQRHPRLTNGRASRSIPQEGGKKPALYIRQGIDIPEKIEPKDVTNQYCEAQGYSPP